MKTKDWLIIIFAVASVAYVAGRLTERRIIDDLVLDNAKLAVRLVIVHDDLLKIHLDEHKWIGGDK